MQSKVRGPWRPIGAIFKEGIEAALAAEPYFLATAKNRTALGWIIRELVCDAGRGKLTALHTMVKLLKWEATEDEEDEEAGRKLSEPQWDWTPERVWEGRPETEEDREEEEQAARVRNAVIAEIEGWPKPDGQARQKVLELLRRREKFEEEERQRKAALAEAAAASENSAQGPPPAAPPDSEIASAPSPPGDGATWVEVNGRQVRLGTRL